MKILKLGSHGPMVEFLQNILIYLGLLSGNIDGIFGQNTKNAVIEFQKQNGLISDGVVGQRTWLALRPYTDGGLGFIVPTNIRYSSEVLNANLNSLKRLYPFIDISSIGKSVMGKDLYAIKIGNGKKEVFYSASFHANEWICSPLVMKFLADYCYCYTNNLPIFGVNARSIYEYCTIYIMPMVNPDGVDLVTGEISPNSSLYTNTELIASNYPNIPFPYGWKANIRGIDLNLQFPAGWNMAKQIKFSQGFTTPSPRDFVGFGPLTEPESLAIYNFTLKHNFRLVIAFHTQGEVIFWQFQNYIPPRSLYVGNQFAQVSRLFFRRNSFQFKFCRIQRLVYTRL